MIRTDFVAQSFVGAAVLLFGTTAFFWHQHTRVAPRWRRLLLVMGLIPLIAGCNYLLMSGLWITNFDPAIGEGHTPTGIRYFDWLLTVPLLCSQFYGLLHAASPGGDHVNPGILRRLVGASVFMLACGFVGERLDPGHNVLWGAVSTVGWLVILYEIGFGPICRRLNTSQDLALHRTFDLLCGFVLVGWTIYPLGYMTQPGNLLAGFNVNFNVIYNVGDVLNKVGFGLALWSMARADAP